jgi:multidrug efflux pump subunit AcrA (membrane-fusion protein)
MFSKTRLALPLIGALTVLFLFPLCAPAAESGDLKLQAQLIWGTDAAKPSDTKIKDLDADTKDRLKGVFKWKNYFEVSSQSFEVGARSSKAIRMSPKCDIEVEHLGDALVEVKLFGEGRLVVKKKQTLKAGELLVLAGDDKNNTAWFVILRARDR